MRNDPDSRAAFAQRLFTLRINAGLSQAELALQAGLNPHTIMRLERGENQPTWRTIRKLAQRFGVRPLDLCRTP